MFNTRFGSVSKHHSPVHFSNNNLSKRFISEPEPIRNTKNTQGPSLALSSYVPVCQTKFDQAFISQPVSRPPLLPTPFVWCSMTSPKSNNYASDDLPELMAKWRMMKEAIQMNRCYPLYSIDQYVTFIENNKQKLKTDFSHLNTVRSKRLHVSNIPFKWTEQHLLDEFMWFGQIDHCTIIRASDQVVSQTEFVSHSVHNMQSTSDEECQKMSARSKGFGFVTFHSQEDAELAKFCKHETWVCDLDANGQKIYDPRTNRRIEVNYATVKRSK